MATGITSAAKSQALSATYRDTGTHNNVSDAITLGSGGIAAFSKSLTDGTGANKANKLWHQQRSISAGANDDLDLRSLTDRFTTALVFSKLKWFFLRLTSPATGVKLVMGNYGANGFTGWFGATTHTEDVADHVDKTNQIDGWTVDATHRYLRINNPGGAAVTYDIILVGEGS